MTDVSLMRVETIAEFVAEESGVSVEMMHMPRCFRDVVHPRQLVMALARTAGKRSTNAIGRYFGLHHTTIIHGSRRAIQRLGLDYEYLHLAVATYEAQRHAQIGERWAL